MDFNEWPATIMFPDMPANSRPDRFFYHVIVAALQGG